MPPKKRDRHARAGSRPDVPAATCSEAAGFRARYLRDEQAATVAAMAALSRLLGRADLYRASIPVQGTPMRNLEHVESHLEKEITG